jgi:hypothetical protein
MTESAVRRLLLVGLGSKRDEDALYEKRVGRLPPSCWSRAKPVS